MADYNIQMNVFDASTASYNQLYPVTKMSIITGTLPIAQGGTGATTAATALTNLGAAPAYQYSTTDLTPGVSTLTTGQLYFVYE